jgi:hypothetical protein
MINFTIRNVFPGTAAQVNVGIHATFNMSIDGPDGIIAVINDMKLMKSREGKFYVDSAFRTYDGKDKEGNPKKVKINYIKFFPEEKNWDKQDAIVKLVLDQIPAKGSPAASPAKPQQNNNNNNNRGNYNNNRPSPAKTTNNEPW